jgi:hypothetical protein
MNVRKFITGRVREGILELYALELSQLVSLSFLSSMDQNHFLHKITHKQQLNERKRKEHREVDDVTRGQGDRGPLGALDWS